MKKKSDKLGESALLWWHQGGLRGCKIKWDFRARIGCSISGPGTNATKKSLCCNFAGSHIGWLVLCHSETMGSLKQACSLLARKLMFIIEKKEEFVSNAEKVVTIFGHILWILDTILVSFFVHWIWVSGLKSFNFILEGLLSGPPD